MANLNFLVIDDEQSMRELLEEFLQMRGHSATTASSGNEGIRLYGEGISGRKYDAVFTDLNMDNGTGEDVVRAVRRHDPEVPVYVVTGNLHLNEYPVLEGLAKTDPKLRIIQKPSNLADLLVQVKQDLKIQP